MTNFIEDALSRKQAMTPQMEYMWRVQLPDISENLEQRDRSDKALDRLSEKTSTLWGKVKAVANPVGTLGEMIASAVFEDDVVAQAEINHRVTSFDLPFPSHETRKVVSYGPGWKAAGNKDISSISLKIMEYEDGATLKYWDGWSKMVQRDDGVHNAPAFYKKNIRFVRMSVTGFDLHVSTCEGCFPVEIGNTNYSYDASGILQYNVTISVDKITHEIIPYDVIVKRIEGAQLEIANSPTSPFSSAFDPKRWFWDVLTGI